MRQLTTEDGHSVAPVPAGMTCTGEIDLAAADDLVESCCHLLDVLAPPPGSLFVLDLSGVTFMDSAGLQALRQMLEAIEEHRLVCQVSEVSHAVRRILELADRLDQVADHQSPLRLPA